jgi:hypothetical protein
MSVGRLMRDLAKTKVSDLAQVDESAAVLERDQRRYGDRNAIIT